MSGGTGDISYSNLISAYEVMSNSVNAATTSIGKSTVAGVQMKALFNLQLKMNVLSMFGQTLTNVFQGIQDIAMAIARNTKGS